MKPAASAGEKSSHRLLGKRREDFGLVLLELIGQLQRVCCQKGRKMLLIVLNNGTQLHLMFSRLTAQFPQKAL
jgi:hypothetical protein